MLGVPQALECLLAGSVILLAILCCVMWCGSQPLCFIPLLVWWRVCVLSCIVLYSGRTLSFIRFAERRVSECLHVCMSGLVHRQKGGGQCCAKP
jgi:hypothetical protein